MGTGVTTANLDQVNLADEVIVNRDGSTGRMAINLLAAQIASEIPGPRYPTRAELYADLAWPELTQAVVWDDPTAAYNGLYRKTGASGAGSWDRYADLPQSSLTATQLAALQGDIDAEATARANAIVALTDAVNASIAAEAAARGDADTALDEAIDAEATARANAVVALTNAVNASIAAQAAAMALKADLEGGKVPLSQLPDAVLGTIQYQGTWNANTNTPTIPAAAAGNKGHYYRVSVAGDAVIDGASGWGVGDWIVSNGTSWEHVDNSEAVTAVAGRTGAVILTKGDVGLDQVDNTPDAEKPVSGPQGEALDLKANSEDLAAVATSGSSDDLTEGGVRLLLTPEERAKAENIAVSLPINLDLVTRLLGFIANSIDARDGQALALENAPDILAAARLIFAIASPSGELQMGIGDDNTAYLQRLAILKDLVTSGGTIAHGVAEGYDFAVTDQMLDLIFGVKNRRMELPGGGKIGDSGDWPIAFMDPDDFVFGGWRDGIWHFGGTRNSLIFEKDGRNLAYGTRVRSISMDVQFPTTQKVTIVGYGQSLMAGNETWPSLSKIAFPGTYMVGDNVDNLSGADSYTVVGAVALNPLVAYTHGVSTNLTDAEEAALTPGDQSIGEPPIIGFARGLKHEINRIAMSTVGRDVVAISPAIGGMTIEQLSKGAANTVDAVDRYSVFTDGIDKVVTLAEADTCAVSVINFMQGEWNYVASYGGVATRAGYLAAQRQLFGDMRADSMAATGQSNPPLILLYQTGAAYTRDTDENGLPGLHVGMAQLDIAQERDDTALVGPIYPYTDKGGHLDSNGSRWYGHQAAKVAGKIFRGEGWEPLKPLEIEVYGRDIYLHFHVPVPPLKWGLPYVISTATDWTDKGFRVTSADGLSTYEIEDIEIVGQTIVRITLTDWPHPDCLVWYASKAAYNGGGCLRDSDPAVAIDTYDYVPERGMYAAANIPDLVGKKYPLPNWCVAFCVPINFTDI